MHLALDIGHFQSVTVDFNPESNYSVKNGMCSGKALDIKSEWIVFGQLSAFTTHCSNLVHTADG